LAVPILRLYRNEDVVGCELGGALKNVIAIACGACIGQGLGESARAALMTRGFSEMQRLAARLGAQPETLMGLSGFGDLVLTCTSAQSRNFAFGHAMGQGLPHDPRATVEGVATVRAAARLAHRLGLDLPIMGALSDVLDGTARLDEALHGLLSRPLKKE
jgi:glycerol-3-phosphate dehydrogenase (NAD(P)+)